MRKITLPKDALTRIDLGDAFAENDLLTRDPSLFVKTPASIAALDNEGRKLFFVGRRGAGKTAIALQIERTFKRAVNIVPQVFDLIELPLNHEAFKDTRQRPFKSLIASFERALLGELISLWIRDKRHRWEDSGPTMQRERGLIENCDFDLRVLNVFEEVFEAFQKDNPKLWLRQINRTSQLTDEINGIADNNNYRYAIILDRLDEAWGGSDSSILSLIAMMHAGVRLANACPWIKPFLFVRENIYERARREDNEFSRIETSVSFLDWTEEKLVELIERRCVKPFTTKPKIGGEAWSHFFLEDESYSARHEILSIAQHRPRDLIMLTAFSMEAAINQNHSLVDRGDIHAGSERYSKSRLKDLGDEFAENYPNIRLVLAHFYGLGLEFTLPAVEEFIQRLLIDLSITKFCSPWLEENSTPHQFIELLYGLGFIGVRKDGKLSYRDAVTDAAFVPTIDSESTFRIHPTYASALRLQDTLITTLPNQVEVRDAGILADLPDGISFEGYQEKLEKLLLRLKELPTGREAADEFEEIVGDVIRLCFFRSLTSLEQRSRSSDGRTIKDWIASNQAIDGFWSRMRTDHSARQVVWECKNYCDLNSGDFHQVSYYLNDAVGRLGILVFRGDEVKTSYYGHADRVMHKDRKGLVLVLRQKDLEVFLRQAIRGTPREAHISEIYIKTIRSIS